MRSGRRKVAAIVTSRASYARIRSALLAIRDSPELELQLILGGSVLLDKYGTAVEVVEADRLPITARVYMVLEGENLPTMAKTTAIGMLELATLFDNLKPDVVVTVADRYETIGTAVTAAYMNIPVAHVQGGEVSGSIDEKVRHAVTKLANVHFAATTFAAQRIVQMGEDPQTVFVTGCPSIDLAADVARTFRGLDFEPFERYKGAGPTLDLSHEYLIVVQHPVTTEYEHARGQIEETLGAIAPLGLPTLWFWPNVDAGSDGISKGVRVFRERANPPHMHFFKNMAPEDFLKVLTGAACIIGNSSVAIREGSYLGVPAVNVGTRQQGRERGPNVLDVGYDREAIRRATKEQIQHGRYPSASLYGDGQAGGMIARLLGEVELRVEKRWYQPASRR